MTRLRWLPLLWAAAGAPAHAQEKELVYDVPQELSIAQVQQAAKSLAARCQSCGLKGVVAVPDTKGLKRVRVTSPTGFADPEPKRVDFLASFPAARIQLRIFHKLTEQEAEKFPPGGKAPPGDSWVDM